MYFLMNKNTAVAAFDKKAESEFSIGISFELKEAYGKLPYGFSNINTWLDGRKASKHNIHLAKIMKVLGCYDNEGFIRITHAATINDTFWVKSDTEQLFWEKISLYRNQFTESISRLAFEGVGLYDAIFSSTSPELACEGSFRKCFRKEAKRGQWGSDIYIYKRGGEGASNVGLEPYCEVLSSEIAQIICPSAVSYELTQLHGSLASRCNLFTNEENGYVPFARLSDVRKFSFEDMFRYFVDLGAEQSFREMLVLDALCFNEDRHAGNFGMIFNNDTLELIKMSPVFDLNISLLAYDKALTNIGDSLYTRCPKLGEDFTRMGQIACNEVIRDRVKDIKDFSFSFRGDDIFPQKRVCALEAAVRKQAEAILSSDKLYTKDVFFSQKAQDIEIKKEQAKTASELMNKFVDRLEQEDLGTETFISVCESENDVQCLIENGSYLITVDFLREKISIEQNAMEISEEQLKISNPDFYEAFTKISFIFGGGQANAKIHKKKF